MATAYHNLSSYDADTMPDASGMKVAIAAAEWNVEITDALLKGAVDTLLRNGVKEENIYVARVPGTVELTFASQQMAEFYQPDAVIAIGCVVRGDTPHFDYVCQSVTQGITHLNTLFGIPFIFGVLTTDKWPNGADCKSAGLRLRWFESIFAHKKIAEVAQLIEHQPSKLRVASLSLVFRSIKRAVHRNDVPSLFYFFSVD